MLFFAVGWRSRQHLVNALAPASKVLGMIRNTLFFQRGFSGGKRATAYTMTDFKVISKQSCSFSALNGANSHLLCPLTSVMEKHLDHNVGLRLTIAHGLVFHL